MNHEDTLRIMAVLKAAYPAYYRDMKRGDAEGIVGLWESMFADEPAEVVALAVKAHIAADRKGFPPHVGAIKDAIVRLKAPEQMTEQEASARVMAAARNGLYGAEEEFAKLPPILQRIVGSAWQLREWAGMEADAVQSVVASNIQRSFRARAETEREKLALPADVREAAERIAAGLRMPALEGKKEEV